jgi:hypothetical protein
MSIPDEAAEAPGNGPSSAGSKRRSPWKRVATVVFVVALFVWVGRRIVGDAEGVDWSNLVVDWRSIALATVAWAIIFVFRAWLWGAMMRRTGYAVGHVAGARVFLASHLGRFLPGKVWSVMGAGIFARELGVPASASAVSMTVFLIMYYLMGSLAALLVVYRLSQGYRWSAVAVGVLGLVMLGFLASRWFPILLHWVGRKTGRNLTDLKLPSPGVLVLVALGLALVWLVAGWALCVMVAGILPPDAAPLSLVDGVGTYAASLVAGFAVLFAPAGLGVREAVMLELLRPEHGGAYAGLIALVSRIIITTLELLLSLWGIWPHLRRKKRGAAAS